MGEAQDWLFEPEFNRSIKVSAMDERITSNAGFLLLREADEKLGLIKRIADQMHDPRDPFKIRYGLTELLRERVYSLAQGYSAQDDLDRLAHDPALRMAVWDQLGVQVLDERLASQPTQSRLIDTLAGIPQNLEILRESLSDPVIMHLHSGRQGERPVRRATVDVDSFPAEIHGKQAGGAYNGYYKQTIYHPLVASFSVKGDYDSSRLGNGFLHAILRKGTVHTGEGIIRFLKNTLEKSRKLGLMVDFRLDAGLLMGRATDFLTRRRCRFIGRMKTNPVLERLAQPYLKRSPGRPPKGGSEVAIELGPYQAESWQCGQRLILVIVDKPDPKTGQLELFPRHFFLVMNWTKQELSASEAVQHYRARGTFEDRLGEFNQAVKPRFSSPHFRENEAALLLGLLAFNLVSMLRCEMEQQAGHGCDLQRFQQTVLTAGARVVKGSRRLTMYIAQSVASLWMVMAQCISRWKVTASWSMPAKPVSSEWMPAPAHAFLHEVLTI